MPAPKTIKAETPGQPGSVPDTPATLARKDAELAKQLGKTAELVGSPDAVDWSILNQQQAAAGKTSPEVVLPDESDVDPDKISEPVLTRQGWVLPTTDPRTRIGAR